jgi:hypothetical protein
MKAPNKQTTKAFNFSECKNLDYELYNYIDNNLFADNITIQYIDKILVFDWKFEPQRNGTQYQRNTYKKITIQKKAEQIIKQICKQILIKNNKQNEH